MTKIADIYDNIITLVETTVPTFKRIPNPYGLDENAAIILRKAYGLAIGAGNNTGRYIGCYTTWEREFTLGLITQVVNTENDATGRALVEIDLLDAHRALLLAFENDGNLSGQAILCEVTDDGGIEYLPGESGKFLALQIGLRVEYQEPLS